MPNDNEPTREELLGMLLWLRNHYDLPSRHLANNEEIRAKVIKAVDQMLEEAKLTMECGKLARLWRQARGL